MFSVDLPPIKYIQSYSSVTTITVSVPELMTSDVENAVEIFFSGETEDIQKNPILTAFQKTQKKMIPKVRRTETKVDLSLSQKWLDENQYNYRGKWVVLDGDKLIGASNNPKELVEVARKAGVKIPFVHFIEDDSRPFVGGWL